MIEEAKAALWRFWELRAVSDAPRYDPDSTSQPHESCRTAAALAGLSAEEIWCSCPPIIAEPIDR